MTPPDQRDVDARIQSDYQDVFDEDARLTTRSAQGPLEFQRTQELIREYAPLPCRVLDVGGGTGVHARALQELGCSVTMLDPVPRHVDAARASGVDAHVGDARELFFADDSFDVVLLLGPLYHLADPTDPRSALSEAARVLAPSGMLFAAALSRYVAFGALSLARELPPHLPEDWARLIVEGHPSPRLRFPAGHFHTAEELQQEVEAAGFCTLDVVGVEGPAGLYLESAADANASVRDAALTIARAAGSVPGIRDQSAHLLAIAQKPA